eukprot:COSAG01_NODE_2507_length_7552_cov_56.408560_7_plen_103_part_00
MGDCLQRRAPQLRRHTLTAAPGTKPAAGRVALISNSQRTHSAVAPLRCAMHARKPQSGALSYATPGSLFFFFFFFFTRDFYPHLAYLPCGMELSAGLRQPRW